MQIAIQLCKWNQNTSSYVRTFLIRAAWLTLPDIPKRVGKFIWTTGQKFLNPPNAFRLILDYSYGNEFPDFFDTTMPVMSIQLIEALQKLGVKNFDLYPATLINPVNKSEIGEYFAINLIGEIDAIDWSCTEHRLRLGRPEVEQSIHLLPENVFGKKAFRLKGGPGFIVVETGVADALTKLNLKGVLLQPVISYNGT